MNSHHASANFPNLTLELILLPPLCLPQWLNLLSEAMNDWDKLSDSLQKYVIIIDIKCDFLYLVFRVRMIVPGFGENIYLMIQKFRGNMMT